MYLRTDYVFNPIARTVTFTNAIALENLLKIVNLADGTVLYETEGIYSRGTLVGHVLTLTEDTTGMDAGDKLSIQVIEGSGTNTGTGDASFAEQQLQTAELTAIQGDLAAVLAKIIATPATEAKQDTGNTSLASLVTLLSPQLEVHTTAPAASLVAKATAGTLFSVSGYNAKVSGQYIQVHNTSSLPADGAVPIKSFYVQASSQFSFDFAGIQGISLSTGITVCNSSSIDTKTIGFTDCRFEVGYK